jgi:dTDP-4-dehydrorhamnose reductase
MIGDYKILITGASGLLGSAISGLYKNAHPLTPGKGEFDITNIDQISNYININNPTLVIHTAAHTNVEEAEIKPDIAWGINTLGTLNLCRSIKDKDVKLIYISSTGIYGHAKKTPWYDFDEVCPPTIHHKTKYAAEQIVQTHIRNHLILRTGWLFGGLIGNPKNFVYNRYRESIGKTTIYANSLQFGNPTYVVDLARQIELLIDKDLIGTFNCVNKGNVSRLEYIKEIMNAFELDISVKALKDKYKRIADVSDNEMAENYFLELLNLNVMEDFRPSLRTYINELKCSINFK